MDLSLKYCLCCLLVVQSINCASAKTMRAIRFKSTDFDSMVVVNEEIPSPKEKEIIVKIAFTAVNRADTIQRKGGYPPPKGASNIIGLEASGTVHALGEGSKKWKVGDQVMVLLPGGGYAEYASVHEGHVMPVPTGFTLKEAGAIPEVWLTAFQLLRQVASTRSGDRVLIHAAASGVGTAAIQMLRHWGAIPMATVGSPEKVELCRQLGAQLVVNRKEDSEFNVRVKEFTNGHGADVILDCVGGSYWERNADALAVDGTWVLYGLLGGADVNGALLGRILMKRARILGSTLRSRSIEYKSDLVNAFTQEILPHMTLDGALRPIIDKEFPLEKANEAHRYMESNANAGKILLNVRGDSAQHGEL